jgi:hypothetical protein
MRHSSGSRQHSFGRRLRTGTAGAIVVGGAIFMGGAASLVTAFAHSGTVTTSETCSAWSASVTLANNVTIDRFVDVVTTIPGTAGITHGHYDTSKGLIWNAFGPAPESGKVTLNIYTNNNGAPGNLEFTTSASLTPAVDCVASPTVTTTASAGGAVGTALHDTATVSGGNSPTGTVTFNLYANTAACNSGTGAVFTSTNALTTSAPFQATSGHFTPTSVGTYQWRATYSGDARNHGASSACGSEPAPIGQAAPAISTTASGGGAVGTVIHDTAIVTGGSNPTGTVSFKLFANTTSCTAGTGALYTSPAEALSASAPLTAHSGSFTPTGVGTYQWLATYSGDANNKSVSSKCGSEPAPISQIDPGITTAASAGGAAPVSVHDTATVSGSPAPTGTVIFSLYADTASCNSGTGALYTSPLEALSGGSATSGSFSITAAGTYQWVAKYSGDANNASVSSKCGDEPVTATSVGGGVKAITTPSTGDTGALTGMTVGGFLLLGGLGAALAGAIVPRRRSRI